MVKIDDAYVGIIHISIRYDHVEGAESNNTAYLEGIYLRPAYRKKQIASAFVVGSIRVLLIVPLLHFFFIKPFHHARQAAAYRRLLNNSG